MFAVDLIAERDRAKSLQRERRLAAAEKGMLAVNYTETKDNGDEDEASLFSGDGM
jgi:hypothetical protein